MAHIFRRCVARVMRHQVSIGVAQSQIAVVIRKGRGRTPLLIREIAGHAGDIESAILALRKLLERYDVKGAACRVVFSDRWVRWAVAPWSNQYLTEPELQAIATIELNERYADMSGWSVAMDTPRYGSDVFVFAIQSQWLRGLESVSKETGLRVRRCQAAYMASVEKFGAGYLADARVSSERDQVFATASYEALTISWKRAATPEGAKRNFGVRSVRLTSNDGDSGVSEQLQRQMLLAHLEQPLVKLINLGATSISESIGDGFTVIEVERSGSSTEAEVLADFACAPVPSRRLAHSLNPFALKPSFEFLQRGTNSGRWALVASMLVALVVGARFYYLEAELSNLQAADSQRAESKVAHVVDRPLSAEEAVKMVAARRIVGELKITWNELFEEIEKANRSDITLIAIAPDVDGEKVRITGDAKSYDAILQFVRSLGNEVGGTSVLRSAFLANYQVNMQDPKHLIRFEAEAAWNVLVSDSAIASSALVEAKR